MGMKAGLDCLQAISGLPGEGKAWSLAGGWWPYTEGVLADREGRSAYQGQAQRTRRTNSFVASFHQSDL